MSENKMNEENQKEVTASTGRSTQAEEMVMAFMEGRQPICVHCGHKLNRVLETQYDDITWVWDSKNCRYRKLMSGESDGPYHDCDCKECENGCGAHDWDFADNDLIFY